MIKRLSNRWMLVSFVALVGCQTAPSHVWQNQPAAPGADVSFNESPYQAPPVTPVMQAQQPQQVQQQLAPQPMMDPTASALLLQQINTLGEALNRVQERTSRLEKAMVRLDRRMQLVERQELDRMSLLPTAPSQGQNLGALNPMTMAPDEAQNPAALPSLSQPFSAEPMARMMPVSHSVTPVSAPQGQITSALQPYVPVQAKVSGTRGMVGNLPSLADADPQKPMRETSLAVWTVQFDQKKIWPDRQQLPFARDVVDALRGEKPVALYARGKTTASREFRDRVRALGRYLGKVSNLENVPIATLPAPHLDDDTIEIFATQ